MKTATHLLRLTRLALVGLVLALGLTACKSSQAGAPKSEHPK